MTKKKVQVPPVLVHLARVGNTAVVRGKIQPRDVTSVFIVAPDLEQAQAMLDEDWYGLKKRGFEVVASYRLAPLGGTGSLVRFPASGCYETAKWIYGGKQRGF